MSMENHLEAEPPEPTAGEPEIDLEWPEPLPEALPKPRPEARPEPLAEARPEPQPKARPEPKVTIQPAKSPKPVTRARLFWTSAGCGLVVLILAIAASLGILAAYNGGLWYASPNRIATVSGQVNELHGQIEIQAQDLSGLRARLDNLEGLSGRIEELEAASGDVQAGLAEQAARLDRLERLGERLEAVAATADRLQSDVLALGAEVEALQERGDRFHRFLEGLQGLLKDLFPEEGGQ